MIPPAECPPSSTRKGIVLAGGAGSRLQPLSLACSKQLLPVYDKPMIYYPISLLMLSGIREILIISTQEDQPAFQRLLGTGRQFGVEFSFAVQPSPDGLPQAFLLAEEFLNGGCAALVLGDNLFYGNELGRVLAAADERREGATIFGYEVADPRPYGVIEFDADGRPLGVEEKPMNPRSRWVIPGLYFFDGRVAGLSASLRASARGELEITDLIRIYLEEGSLQVERFGRGAAWLDMGTPDALLEAGHFVQTIQNRQGLQIACLEEIAFARGWMPLTELQKSAERLKNSSYGRYLAAVVAAARR